MNKKYLSESDLCDKYIRPAMVEAGWHGIDQIYREFPLRAGRVVVRGQRVQRDQNTVLRADYALFYKPNIPLAVVEAKTNQHAMGAGMGQAINYAELLGVPFIFAITAARLRFTEYLTRSEPDAGRHEAIRAQAAGWGVETRLNKAHVT